MAHETEAERLAAEKQYFDAVLDSMSDGVLVCDSAMRVTKFNSAAEQITGWSRTDAIGAPCPDIFHGYLCGHGCAVERTAAGNHGVRDQEVMIQHRNGEQRLIVLTTSTVRAAGGGSLCVVAVFRDITELARLRTELRGRAGFPNLVGRSPAMQTLYEQIEDVATSEASVLLLGETGVGKELVAEAIHRASRRAAGPLIKVNCSALSEGLLESELFGHVRGAFTGAAGDHRGLFEEASGGTLLLDEIGEMPPALQAKLLRALQEGEIRRVGDRITRRVDVRVVAATARDLAAEVGAGRFREDLFYRLNVVAIALRPLADRPEDIAPLITAMLARHCASLKTPPPRIEPDAWQALLDYNWPGNVRELSNALERALVLAHDGTIRRADLPLTVLGSATPRPGGQPLGSDLTLKVHQGQLESSIIRAALQRAGGNRRAAAALLGISARTLFYKLRQLGIADSE